MKFKYTGPHDAVDVPGVGTVERGASIEVSGDAAKGLLRQSEWERTDQPKSKES